MIPSLPYVLLFGEYVLDSGWYGLAAFLGAGTLAPAETMPSLPAAGRKRHTRSGETALQIGCQSTYLSQAPTQLFY